MVGSEVKTLESRARIANYGCGLVDHSKRPVQPNLRPLRPHRGPAACMAVTTQVSTEGSPGGTVGCRRLAIGPRICLMVATRYASRGSLQRLAVTVCARSLHGECPRKARKRPGKQDQQQQPGGQTMHCFPAKEEDLHVSIHGQPTPGRKAASFP